MRDNKKRPFGLIYGLNDPRTNELRYVGQTTRTLLQRLSQHCAPGALQRKSHLTNWVRALRKQSLRPRIVLLECADTIDELNLLELRWIYRCRRSGAKLVNQRIGGDNSLHSAETRARMSAAHSTADARARKSETQRGRVHSAEHNARVSAAKRGVPVPPAVRAKIAATLRGRPRSAEAIQKAAVSNRGKKRTPEQIERSADKRRGQKRSPEACEKMREAWRRRKAKQETCRTV